MGMPKVKGIGTQTIGKYPVGTTSKDYVFNESGGISYAPVDTNKDPVTGRIRTRPTTKRSKALRDYADILAGESAIQQDVQLKEEAKAKQKTAQEILEQKLYGIPVSGTVLTQDPSSLELPSLEQTFITARGMDSSQAGVQIEKLGRQLGDKFNAFSEKYGGRELSEEEYAKAQREQVSLRVDQYKYNQQYADYLRRVGKNEAEIEGFLKQREFESYFKGGSGKDRNLILPGQKGYEDPSNIPVIKKGSGVKAPTIKSSEEAKESQRYKVELSGATEKITDTKNNIVYTSTGKENLYFDDKYDVYKFEGNAFVKASRQEFLGFAKDFAQESASKTLVLGQAPINLALKPAPTILGRLIAKAKDKLVGTKKFVETDLVSTRLGKSISTKQTKFELTTSKGITSPTPKGQEFSLLKGKGKATITTTEIGTGILNKGKIVSTTTTTKPFTYKLKAQELMSSNQKLKVKDLLGIESGLKRKNIPFKPTDTGTIIQPKGKFDITQKALTTEPLSLEKAKELAKSSYTKLFGKIRIGEKLIKIDKVISTKLSSGTIQKPLVIQDLIKGETKKVFSGVGEFSSKSLLGKKAGTSSLGFRSVDVAIGETPEKSFGKIVQSTTTASKRSIVRSKLTSTFYTGPKGVGEPLKSFEIIAPDKSFKPKLSLNDLFKPSAPSVAPVVEVSSGGGTKLLLKQQVLPKVEVKPVVDLSSGIVKQISSVAPIVSKAVSKAVQVKSVLPTVTVEPIKNTLINVSNPFKSNYILTYKPGKEAYPFVGQQTPKAFSSFGKDKSVFPELTKKLSFNMGDTLSITDRKFMPKVKTSTTQRTRTGSRNRLITESASDLGLKLDTAQAQQLLNKQDVKLGQQVSVAQKVGIAQAQAQLLKQAQAQQVRQSQLLKFAQVNLVKPSFKITTITPNIPIIPRVGFGFKTGPFSGKFKSSGVKAYDVLVRKKGEFVKVASKLPIARATRYGAFVTDVGSSARTFKLQEAGTTKLKDIKKVDLSRFRTPSKRSSLKGPLTFIEKSKYAISSSSEKREIPGMARLVAKRNTLRQVRL